MVAGNKAATRIARMCLLLCQGGRRQIIFFGCMFLARTERARSINNAMERLTKPELEYLITTALDPHVIVWSPKPYIIWSRIRSCDCKSQIRITYRNLHCSSACVCVCVCVCRYMPQSIRMRICVCVCVCTRDSALTIYCQCSA
jgi:hypothetical protein